MADKKVRSRLTLTRDDVMTALRNDGWSIPDPATDPTVTNLTLAVDGAEVPVQWDQQTTETQAP